MINDWMCSLEGEEEADWLKEVGLSSLVSNFEGKVLKSKWLNGMHR